MRYFNELNNYSWLRMNNCRYVYSGLTQIEEKLVELTFDLLFFFFSLNMIQYVNKYDSELTVDELTKLTAYVNKLIS